MYCLHHSPTYSIFLSLAGLSVAYFFALGLSRSRSLVLLIPGVGSLIMGGGYLISQLLTYASLGTTALRWDSTTYRSCSPGFSSAHSR